jgi:hypothetical protein
MRISASVIIDGVKLANIRYNRKLSQKEFCDYLSVSQQRLSQIESGIGGIYRKTFLKIAEFLSLNDKELFKLIGAEKKKTVAKPSCCMCNEPLFDITVAAGGWVSNLEIGRVKDEAQAAKGMFWIRIAGDSMEPVYNSGECVKFKSLANGDEGIQVGKDYYVHRNDDCATFKRVLKIEGESVTLVAINERKYPKALNVSLQEIVQAARAIGKYTEI